MSQLTWLVTGCSSGFGEHCMQHLEEAGAGTLQLDITARQSELDAKIEAAIKIRGGVDVLINNASYVQLGALEDVSHEQYLAQFNTNVFGTINTTRAILPHFRQRKVGTVVFIGSVAAWHGTALDSPYCASKYALAGIAEAFQQETAHLGIKSLLVEPGVFRTKLLAPQNLRIASTKHGDYAEALLRKHSEGIAAVDGKQLGDARRAAERIVDVVTQELKVWRA